MKLKLSKLATWAFAFGLALPVFAAEQPGVISGYVRNASGTPQMGAVVQILGSARRTLTVFTDENGYYSATGLPLKRLRACVKPARKESSFSTSILQKKLCCCHVANASHGMLMAIAPMR